MSQPENRIILDKLYPLADAAALMGLKHANDVVRLHEKGEITLRMRRVRGEKGRPVALGADIVHYNTSLPARPRKQRFEMPGRPSDDVPADSPQRAARKRGERRVGKTIAESFDA